jgi:hypothetical protein
LRKILKMAKISAWTKTRVRSFIGWYRHITLVLLALAYLAGICATERFPTGHPTTAESAAQLPILPLTIVSRAPFACTAHLAFVFVRTPGACLVLVASLPPKRGELLPHQTSFEGRLILADSYSLDFALARDHFLDFLEISWKCRSSWKSVRVLSPICSFLERSAESMTLLPVADGARLLGIHRHSPPPLAQRGQYAPGYPPDGCT